MSDITEVAPELSTQPAPAEPPARFGVIGWWRWIWRTLTSMRTALILLFLLALAAIPGSVLPQRGNNALNVAKYYQQHPHLAPVLNRFSLFDVFAARWFAAIYILLFTSLAGCVVPRSWQHFRALRARPPAPPRRLDRLPHSDSWHTTVPTQTVYDAMYATLRARRFRVDRHATGLAAEKGYLRETGNLVFHLALLLLLAGVALGGLVGYKGTRLVVEGDGFANAEGAYDSWHHGRLTSASSLTPFTLHLDKFDATYVEAGAKIGEARSFDAHVHYQPKPGAPTRSADIRSNHPLTVGGARVYLVGHGYAPHFIVRDDTGRIAFDGAVPFLPQDGNFDSTGVIKVPDARPQQLGFSGFFAPTAVPTSRGFVSVFPGPRNPGVVLLAYRGNLGLDSGVPQSVYALDDARLTRVATAALGIGDVMKLPDGKATLTYVGLDQWASFQVTYDPGKQIVLIAAVVMIAGLLLSLRIRRRRVWARVSNDESGTTVVEAAGLGRTDSGAFEEEFADLVAELRQATQQGSSEGTGA
ncbi:MAG: cytochrome c biogenesis protein ResB [Actinomycetes bacterium]